MGGEIEVVGAPNDSAWRANDRPGRAAGPAGPGADAGGAPGVVPGAVVLLQGRLAWLPSQNGPFLECLQPHHATVLASVISVFTGVNGVPLCEPSQKGWLLDWPQLHQ